MSNKVLNAVQLVNFATSAGFDCQFCNTQRGNALSLTDAGAGRFAVLLDSLPLEPNRAILKGLALHLGIKASQLNQEIAAQPRRWLTLWPGTSQ